MIDRYDILSERICEYSVSSTRKKLWVVEMDILEMIEKTCQENDIDYFMLMGSAIGAVRHQGFIPWDDDIDIGMLREDFDKFLQCDKSFFPDYIDIQYGVSDRGVDLLLRIRDGRTTGIMRAENDLPGNKGAFVEIYVYDYVKDDFISNIQLKASRLFCSLMYAKTTPAGKNLLLRLIASIFPLTFLWNCYVTNCKLRKKEKCEFVNLVSLPKYGQIIKHRATVSDLAETEYMNYEYMKVRVAKGNENYLKQLYGDFMKLPPVEKRGAHHNNIVFYDPDKSYLDYRDSDVPQRYFSGESSLELL